MATGPELAPETGIVGAGVMASDWPWGGLIAKGAPLFEDPQAARPSVPKRSTNARRSMPDVS
jgi:hypothetical protein